MVSKKIEIEELICSNKSKSLKRVDIKIGFACNNRCFFCVQGRKRKRISAKEVSLLKKNIEDSFLDNYREVVFTGGEPTLHPNFLELVSFAKKIGYQEIQIQTNGRTFFYLDFCKKTIQAGATCFGPSLHGHNEKTHDFLTRSRGSFSQTVQGIINLKKLGQRVITNTVITSKNYKHLPKLARLLVNLGVDQFQLAFIHLGGEAFENRKWITPMKKEVAPFVKESLEIGIKAGVLVMVEAITPCLLRGYEEYISELFIPRAKVFDIDYNIEDYDLYRKTKGKIKRKKCEKCIFFHICEGPWKEYPEIFGWNEFVPILSSD